MTGGPSGTPLAAIAAGALLGGRLADAVDPWRLLGPLLLVGGALMTLVPFVVRTTGATLTGAQSGTVLRLAALAVSHPRWCCPPYLRWSSRFSWPYCARPARSSADCPMNMGLLPFPWVVIILCGLEVEGKGRLD